MKNLKFENGHNVTIFGQLIETTNIVVVVKLTTVDQVNSSDVVNDKRVNDKNMTKMHLYKTNKKVQF